MMMPKNAENNLVENLNTEIREFVMKQFPLARKRQIKDSDALLESGMLDSQGVLEVVTFIETRLAVTVSDEDLIPSNFQTIERIVDFVRSKTAAGA